MGAKVAAERAPHQEDTAVVRAVAVRVGELAAAMAAAVTVVATVVAAAAARAEVEEAGLGRCSQRNHTRSWLASWRK